MEKLKLPVAKLEGRIRDKFDREVPYYSMSDNGQFRYYFLDGAPSSNNLKVAYRKEHFDDKYEHDISRFGELSLDFSPCQRKTNQDETMEIDVSDCPGFHPESGAYLIHKLERYISITVDDGTFIHRGEVIKCCKSFNYVLEYELNGSHLLWKKTSAIKLCKSLKASTVQMSKNERSFINHRQLTVFSVGPHQNLPELNPYIGVISGYHCAPYLYQTDHEIVTISIGPIYGYFEVSSWPENYLYLSCEINEQGRLVGPVFRTPFIPMKEKPSQEETPVIHRGKLMYARYYHPLTGQHITPKQYQTWIKAVKFLVSRYLSADLTDLLGYI